MLLDQQSMRVSRHELLQLLRHCVRAAHTVRGFHVQRNTPTAVSVSHTDVLPHYQRFARSVADRMQDHWAAIESLTLQSYSSVHIFGTGGGWGLPKLHERVLEMIEKKRHVHMQLLRTPDRVPLLKETTTQVRLHPV
jgi:hypothetical protein